MPTVLILLLTYLLQSKIYLIPSFPTELDERAFLGAKQVRY